MAKTNKAAPKPRIQQTFEALRRLANEASTKYALLSAKAKLAKAMWDNGASLESVCEKLSWPVAKLESILDPNTDIVIRELADVGTALGREIKVKLEGDGIDVEVPA